MVIVYFDTNIWISYLYSYDSNHSIAQAEIQKVRNRTYTVLISRHVLNEVFDLFKKKFITHGLVRNSPRHQKTRQLETLVRGNYQTFSNLIASLPNVRFKEPKADLPMEKSLDILLQYFGSVNEKTQCPICDQNYPFLEYDGFYEADALHVAIAHALNCEIFKTFDKDYKVLENEQIIAPLNIEVIS